MEHCLSVTGHVRSVKLNFGLVRRHLPEVVLVCQDPEARQIFVDNTELIQTLVPCGRIQVLTSAENLNVNQWFNLEQQTFAGQIFVQLHELVQVDQELSKISKKLAKVEMKLKQHSKNPDIQSNEEENEKK